MQSPQSLHPNMNNKSHESMTALLNQIKSAHDNFVVNFKNIWRYNSLGGEI